ncbi:MAG: sugar phosphate isomerase/epimerase [Clostridiales bacterium]|nr:sugar phosphate isomerase/epimerase [Candidatus Equinaster intestinalis]
MRYGVCVDADYKKLAKLKEFGYDYAEIPLSVVSDWDETQIEEFLAESKKTGIYAEAVNCFFKYGGSYLVKPGIDYSDVENYLETALSKAQKLGTKVAVIGCGGARQIPDDVNWEDGVNQFATVFGLSAKIAEKYGITVVVEPLYKGNSNFINTVAEGIDICKKANHKNAKVLADFFHVAMTGESLDAIENCGETLAHLHIARANSDRKMPINPEDKPVCERWAAAIKKNGYNERMSLEGNFGENWDETVKQMREVLKIFD